MALVNKGVVEKIEKLLKSKEITYEFMGVGLIYTDDCTIDVGSKSITVNEKPVELEDIIYEVLAVERP